MDDACIAALCDLWNVQGSISGLIALALWVRVWCILYESASVGIGAFGGLMNAAAESDCDDVVDTEEVPD